MPGPRGLHRSPPRSSTEWKKSAEPLHKQWADNVRKAGGDPDAIMKELKQSLAQIQGGVLTGAARSQFDWTLSHSRLTPAAAGCPPPSPPMGRCDPAKGR